MAAVRDLHFSGYHDATEEAWEKFAEILAAEADLAGVTEARHFIVPDGWGLCRSKVRGAECAAAWNGARFRVAGPVGDCEGAARLTDRVFYTGRGHARPGVVATWVLLRDLDTRQDILRLVVHFPASVQRGDWFNRRNLRRVRAWQSAIRGLRKAIIELAEDLRPDEITVSADWNVDLTRRQWRLVINTGLRGTGCRVKAPAGGTHHDRAIDAHATTMRRAWRHGRRIAIRVLDRIRGFDHLAVLAHLIPRKEKS